MKFGMAALRLKNENPVLSYKRMRQAIGVAGMALPLGCYLAGLLFSGLGLQNSISAYYYTNVRDVFVGILVCVGLFLLAYKGHERIDNLATSISSLFALPWRYGPDRASPAHLRRETLGRSNLELAQPVRRQPGEQPF